MFVDRAAHSREMDGSSHTAMAGDKLDSHQHYPLEQQPRSCVDEGRAKVLVAQILCRR